MPGEARVLYSVRPSLGTAGLPYPTTYRWADPTTPRPAPHPTTHRWGDPMKHRWGDAMKRPPATPDPGGGPRPTAVQAGRLRSREGRQSTELPPRASKTWCQIDDSCLDHPFEADQASYSQTGSNRNRTDNNGCSGAAVLLFPLFCTGKIGLICRPMRIGRLSLVPSRWPVVFWTCSETDLGDFLDEFTRSVSPT